MFAVEEFPLEHIVLHGNVFVVAGGVVHVVEHPVPAPVGPGVAGAHLAGLEQVNVVVPVEVHVAQVQVGGVHVDEALHVHHGVQLGPVFLLGHVVAGHIVHHGVVVLLYVGLGAVDGHQLPGVGLEQDGAVVVQPVVLVEVGAAVVGLLNGVEAPVLPVQEELHQPVVLGVHAPAVHALDQGVAAHGGAVDQKDLVGEGLGVEERLFKQGAAVVLLPGVEGEGLGDPLPAGVAVAADAGLLGEGEALVLVEEVQVGGALPGGALAEEVGVAAHAAPIGLGGDGAVGQLVLVLLAGHQNAQIPEQVVGVADQRHHAHVIVGAPAAEAHEVGGGHGVADVALCVHGHRPDHGALVQILRGGEVVAVVVVIDGLLPLIEGGVGVEALGLNLGEDVGLRRGVLHLNGLGVGGGIRRGAGAVHRVVNGAALRGADAELEGLVVEAAGHREHRLRHALVEGGAVVGGFRRGVHGGAFQTAVLHAPIGAAPGQVAGDGQMVHHIAAAAQAHVVSAHHGEGGVGHAGVLHGGAGLIPQTAGEPDQQSAARLHAQALREGVAAQVGLLVAQTPAVQGDGLVRGVVELHPAVVIAVRGGEDALVVGAHLVDHEVVGRLLRDGPGAVGVVEPGQKDHGQQGQQHQTHRRHGSGAVGPGTAGGTMSAAGLGAAPTRGRVGAHRAPCRDR